MQVYYLPPMNCLSCGHVIGAHAGEGPGPAPGDYAVCFYCSTVHVFQPGPSLRLAEAQEIIDCAREIHRARQ